MLGCVEINQWLGWATETVAVGHGAAKFDFRMGLSVLAVVATWTYMMSFSLGIGPGCWLVASEVFPLVIRAKCMALATVANRVFSSLIASTFLSWAGAMSLRGIFLLLHGAQRRALGDALRVSAGDVGEVARGDERRLASLFGTRSLRLRRRLRRWRTRWCEGAATAFLCVCCG